MGPEIFRRIRKIEITAKKLADETMTGVYHSAFKGRGQEFQDIREYIEGDDSRIIDWNVTARMNRTFVKNFSEERELSVLLLVDISGSSQFGSKKQTKREMMTEISALLGFMAVKNHDKTGLLLFTDKVEHYVPPRKGVKHILRIIRDLLYFKPTSRSSDLKCALDYLGGVRKKKCICFIISDFLFPLPMHELALTAKKHDVISFCITDECEQSFPFSDPVMLRDLETGEMRLVDAANAKERVSQYFVTKNQTLRESMRKVESDCLFINSNDSYEKKLRIFFKKRKGKSR